MINRKIHNTNPLKVHLSNHKQTKTAGTADLGHVEPAARTDPNMHILWLADAMLLVGGLNVHSDPVHAQHGAIPMTVVVRNLDTSHAMAESEMADNGTWLDTSEASLDASKDSERSWNTGSRECSCCI